MFKVYGFALFLAVAGCALHSGDAQTLIERNGIVNATLLTSLREFPHQVGIYVGGYENSYCSGSIISRSWVLTAATCVYDVNYVEITLMFNRLNVNQTAFGVTELSSYMIKVVHSAANFFLNRQANLALIRLPVALQFGVDVAPIALAIHREEVFAGRHAVMAGVRQNTTREAYGQFEITTDARCKQTYSWYNPEQELCTLGWRNSSTVPCANAQGGGLVIDWPSAPRLVGVFSAPLSCLSYVPAEYVRVSGHLKWIEDTVGQRVNNNGYFF